jgi:peptidyl-prolyl cis-trans isomerase SurA
MRRAIPILSALCLLAGAALAVIVDRIVVTVGTQAITSSELELTVRLTAFLNQAPIDFSTENRRKTVERLIEQRIVLKELDFSRFPRPSMEEVEPRLRTIINLLFADDEAAYRAALEKYGITEDDLKRYLPWQSTFFGFIDFRFRPGIQVTDAEIEEYFKSRILPLAQKANPGKTIALDEYHDRIERILMARREEVEMQGWLAETRKRTKIDYRDEELKPQPAEGAPKPAQGAAKPEEGTPK